MKNQRLGSKDSFLKKYGLYLLFALIVLVRIPFLNKGIDYTDTGYNIEKYKNVFYGNGISDIGMFYTDLIGGLIYYLLPEGQLLVYRILHWMIWLATACVGYQLFKNLVKPVYYWLFMLALATQVGGEMIFSYYPMTQLLLIISVYFLYSGLTKQKKGSLLISGFISCINIFCRLTNLFYLVMFFAIPWYATKKAYGKKRMYSEMGCYIIGVFIGALVTFGIMLAFMGWNEVAASFIGYVEVALGLSGSRVTNFLGVEEVSGHSLLAEVKMIGLQGLQSIAVFVSFYISILLVTFVMETYMKRRGDEVKKRFVTCGVMMAVTFAGAAVFAGKIVSIIPNVMGLGVITLCVFLLFFGKEKDAEISTICLITFLLSIFSVIGTDKGLQRLFLVRTLHVGMLLVLTERVPMYWDAFMETKAAKVIFRRIGKDFMRNFVVGFALITGVSILATGLFNCMTVAYCDGKYSEMTSTCQDIPLLKGMYTSEIRAAELEEYCELMSAEELQDKEVALFGFFPLGLVIGPQRDYFEAVDPCVDYPRFSVEVLLEAIQEKEEEGIVPVIVLSQVDRIQRGRVEGTPITSQAKQAVIDYMLSLHDYSVFAQTDYYTIFLAKE